MRYTWFKFHHDLLDDFRIRRFTAQEQLAWVKILCVASRSEKRGTVLIDDDDLAEYCGFNATQDWLYYRDKLIAKGLIDFNDCGRIHVIGWDEMQYEKPSDRPEEIKKRVAKHRARAGSKSETRCNALQTPSNAEETPLKRTDQIRSEKNRSDQEINTLADSASPDAGECDSSGEDSCQGKKGGKGDRITEEFERFWQKYPRKVDRAPALKAFKAKRKLGHSLEDMVARLEYDCRDWQEKKTEAQYIPYGATWLNKERWLSEDWKRSPAQIAKSGGYPFKITGQQIRAWLDMMAEFEWKVEFLEHVNPDNPDPTDRDPKDWGVKVEGSMMMLGAALKSYDRGFLERDREWNLERAKKKLEGVLR